MFIRHEPDKITLKQIPEGSSGIHATLKAMAELTRQYRRNPEMLTLAREIVSAAPEKSYRAEARLLHQFVRDEIRYTRDPTDVETLSSPEHTLHIRMGDCDDKSVLLGTLLAAVGAPVRYVAVGLNGGEFEHVYPEVLIGRTWTPAETTEQVNLGWSPPNVTKRMTVYV